jgi:mevalonate kinase
MKKTVIVSSPGKLILGGEHAVVYGRRALVTSIGMRLYMQLTEDDESDKQLLNISFHDTNKQYSIDLLDLQDSYPLEIQAILYVCNHFKSLLSDKKQLNLQVRSDIPIGAGLGSSAAFSVCLVGCFHLLYYKKLNQEDVNKLAYDIECIFHGTPSGIDNTISTYGQSLMYSRTLKKHLDFHLSNLAIIDTGIPKSTKKMVDLVRLFIGNNPNEGEQILNNIEQCVDMMVEHPEEINQYFQNNQLLLQSLGVSMPEIDNIIEILGKNNISAKITGAGGGGCLIASTSSFSKDEIFDLLKNNPIKSIHFVECGVEGLREEQSFF